MHYTFIHQEMVPREFFLFPFKSVEYFKTAIMDEKITDLNKKVSKKTICGVNCSLLLIMTHGITHAYCTLAYGNTANLSGMEYTLQGVRFMRWALGYKVLLSINILNSYFSSFF